MITFKQFLNEADPDYNIKKQYDFFNRELFDGNLPDNFTMRFRRTKSTGGAVRATYYTKGKGSRKTIDSYEIQELYLSTFNQRTDDELNLILIHEMIHVWMMVNELHEGYNVILHGKEFKKKRDEISKKSGLDIPMIDNLSDVIRDKKNTAYGVVIIKGKLGSTISLFNKKYFDANVQEISRVFNKVANGEVFVGTSKHSELEKFSPKRGLKKIFTSYLESDLEKEIMKDFEKYEFTEEPEEKATTKTQSYIMVEFNSGDNKLILVDKFSSKKTAMINMVKFLYTKTGATKITTGMCEYNLSDYKENTINDFFEKLNAYDISDTLVKRIQSSNTIVFDTIKI